MQRISNVDGRFVWVLIIKKQQEKTRTGTTDKQSLFSKCSLWIHIYYDLREAHQNWARK